MKASFSGYAVEDPVMKASFSGYAVKDPVMKASFSGYAVEDPVMKASFSGYAVKDDIIKNINTWFQVLIFFVFYLIPNIWLTLLMPATSFSISSSVL